MVFFGNVKISMLSKFLLPTSLFCLLIILSACHPPKDDDPDEVSEVEQDTFEDTEQDSQDSQDSIEIDNSDVSPVPYSTTADYLTIWNGTAYEPIFLKGMNLGVGVPGTSPGELAVTSDQYARWLNRMGEMGINSLRIYTLHYPRFYEEFARYNLEHPEAPIYLLQGIWLDEENPTGTLDLTGLTESFDIGIGEVIDCVHGQGELDHRFGRAYGTYTVDVSQWVLGWIIGREISPWEVMETNERHPELRAYYGENLNLSSGTPSEVWAAARVDKVISYERGHYGYDRPVSMSSWPTLDPLTHPTEGSNRHEDVAVMDLGNLELINAPGGYFATFHAYPYYPDFVSEDPDYRQYSDSYGPNNYLGYLHALKAHYSNIPLFIGEFGVPSSWGNAHYSYSGMDHGGHSEEDQGKWDARMLRNMYDSQCAGGALFAWMDEWWKRTWITDQIDFPRERRMFWHNVTAAEQNFGLVTFEEEPPDWEEWPPVLGTGRIRGIQADWDAKFFHLKISLSEPLAYGETITVGYDTYRDDLGESMLPDGVSTGRRSEISLVVTSPDYAQLYVTPSYDLFAIYHFWLTEPYQRFRSEPSDGDPWIPVRWMNGDEHGSDSGEFFFEATTFDIGKLKVRNNSDEPSNLDAVIIGFGTIYIQIPWILLNFTDPTTLTVMHDNRDTLEHETVQTQGIAVSVSFYGELLETDRFVWPSWNEAPPTTEREKKSLEIFAEGVRSIPDL